MPTEGFPAIAAGFFDHAVGVGDPGGPGDSGSQVRRLAVIGLAKNVGKTVTLGVLAEEAGRRGLRLGLCSTGRDGERQDAVTELPKPAIWGAEGTLLATAEGALGQGTAAIEVLERLRFATPFGQALVGRVIRAGTVLLIGPGTISRLEVALQRLESHGAQLCLVDGSLDRLAAAAPGVTEAVVVATGGALGPAVEDVVRQTGLALDVLRLPGLEDGQMRHRAEEVMGLRPVTLLDGDDLKPRGLDLATAAGAAGAILAEVGAATRAIVLGGALPCGLLQAVGLEAALCRRLTFVVRDATRVFPEPLEWRRFRRQGGMVLVLHPLAVGAVTSNPWSPIGPALDPAELHRAVAAAAAPAPVYDVVAGLGPRARA